MGLLQLKDPLKLFMKKRELLRASGFLSRRDMTPGGGGHSGTEGGRTCVTYFAEEGVFF